MKHTSQECTLIDHMGDDQSVVNAARVSFGKRKESNRYKLVVYGPDRNIEEQVASVDKADTRLINFLAREGHWTPFGHASVQFHIKAPFFVARQLGKHQVGLVWNEISRRYVDTDPEFYLPENWRLRNKDKKQGSLDETKEESVSDHTQACLDEYHRLLNENIAPEMARMVLPQNTMTEWYWSGSLYAFARVCALRLPKDAQKETREIAEMISKQLSEMFPVSWRALMKASVKGANEKSDNKVNESGSSSGKAAKRQKTA